MIEYIYKYNYATSCARLFDNISLEHKKRVGDIYSTPIFLLLQENMGECHIYYVTTECNACTLMVNVHLETA